MADEKKKERPSIYMGFVGTFDAASLVEKVASTGKPYADVTMQGQGASRVIRAWGKDRIEDLKEAVAAGETAVQGYSSAKGYMEFHRAGADKIAGIVSNVRKPEADNQPVSFVVEFEANNGEKMKKVAIAFGENRGDIAAIEDGAKVEFDSVAGRRKVTKEGAEYYRSFLSVCAPIAVVEPAPKKGADAGMGM